VKYISRIPDQRARQDKWSGMEAQEDSCKARGNRSGKSPEVVITQKRRPERKIGQQLSLYSQRNIEEHRMKLKYQTRRRTEPD